MTAAPSPPRPAGGSVTAHAGGPALSNQYDHDDILVVVSKVKKYIRDRGGVNTSDAIAEALGAHVRKVCDDAIRNAVRDGRKTVLDRDVPPAFPRGSL
jgi:ATP-dependent 26S proteasome regulatory subunit